MVIEHVVVFIVYGGGVHFHYVGFCAGFGHFYVVDVLVAECFGEVMRALLGVSGVIEIVHEQNGVRQVIQCEVWIVLT